MSGRGTGDRVAPGRDAPITEPVVAVVVTRSGRLPVGAEAAVARAGGRVVVVGSGAKEAVAAVESATRAWWCDTGVGLRPGLLAGQLAPVLAATSLVILPASPDGRDLAPRLAAVLGRPLLANVTSVDETAETPSVRPDGSATGAGATVRATVSRLDDRVLIPVSTFGPAVATMGAGGRLAPPGRGGGPARVTELVLEADPTPSPLDPDILAVLEPEPATMDLADATRVMAGGAGLAAGTGDDRARAVFALLAGVAAAMGASSGATRVATDAGWAGYERQIGTTGVAIDPDLYLAFGISGASQHVGGLGAPRHVVSVNLDPSAPMTALADLGLVTDARALLIELAHRFGVPVPEQVR